MYKHMANDRGVNNKITADWFFQNKGYNRQRTEVTSINFDQWRQRKI